MPMNLSLKVTPQEVREKASQIENVGSAMEQLMSDMAGQVKSLTEGAWKSTAGVKYAERYTEGAQEIKGCLENLAQHIRNLVDVANTYERVEQTDVGSNVVDKLNVGNIF